MGAALIVYAPIAIFGPVQELSTPNGPLHCDGSALSLRNRHSIPRDPQRNDCRSQAEDQTSGAVASFFVGVAMVAARLSSCVCTVAGSEPACGGRLCVRQTNRGLALTARTTVLFRR